MSQTDVLSQTDVMSTAVAAELLQSVGVELSIFVITVIIAVVVRGAPLNKGCSASVFYTKDSQDEHNKAARRSSPRQPQPQQHSPQESFCGAPGLAQKIDLLLRHAQRRSAQAMTIYEELRAQGQHTAIKEYLSGKSRAAELFGLLVQCAGKAGQPKLIELLLDDMKLMGIERSLTFYETTMKMLAASRCYREALCVCSRLEADGLEPSPVTLSCLISFAAEIHQMDKAIGFFNRLAATSTPSIRAYMTILRVYSKRPDFANALSLLRDMQSRNAPIDCLVVNIVLATGVAAGELFAAKTLLNEFSQIGIADVISYNTVMKGFAQQKEANAALKLLDEMCQAGLKPNAITFNTTMDAAVRSCRVADAWGVLVRMIEAGLTPDKFTCTTLMKGLQTGATSEQLTMILELLRTSADQCDASLRSFLFRNVIEATARVNDAVLTAKAIAQMREQRVMLSAPEFQRLLKVLMREA